MSIPQGGKYNITIYEGATYLQEFTLEDTDGEPINLTGYTAKAQVWDRVGGTKLADLTCVIDPLIGKITVSASSTVTGSINKVGYWSLEIADGAVPPTVYVLLEGRCLTHTEITV